MKPWYKSKSVIVGLLQLVASLSLFGYQFLSENEIEFDNPTMVLLFVNGIVMCVLRWLTSEPISSIAKQFDKLRPGVLLHNSTRDQSEN